MFFLLSLALQGVLSLAWKGLQPLPAIGKKYLECGGRARPGISRN